MNDACTGGNERVSGVREVDNQTLLELGRLANEAQGDVREGDDLEAYIKLQELLDKLDDIWTTGNDQ